MLDFDFIKEAVDAVVPDEDFLPELVENVGDRVDYIVGGGLVEDLTGPSPGDVLGGLSPGGLLGDDINDFIGDLLFG